MVGDSEGLTVGNISIHEGLLHTIMTNGKLEFPSLKNNNFLGRPKKNTILKKKPHWKNRGHSRPEKFKIERFLAELFLRSGEAIKIKILHLGRFS